MVSAGDTDNSLHIPPGGRGGILGKSKLKSLKVPRSAEISIFGGGGGWRVGGVGEGGW